MVNKSQGETYDHVGGVLTDAVFLHGQLNVALTGATSEHNLKLFIVDNKNRKLY